MKIRCIPVLSNVDQTTFRQTNQEKQETTGQKAITPYTYRFNDRTSALSQNCSDDLTDARLHNFNTALNLCVLPCDYPSQPFNKQTKQVNLCKRLMRPNFRPNCTVLPSCDMLPKARTAQTKMPYSHSTSRQQPPAYLCNSLTFWTWPVLAHIQPPAGTLGDQLTNSGVRHAKHIPIHMHSLHTRL